MLQPKEVFFEKVGGIFGGYVPPTWGVNFGGLAGKIAGISPPNCVFWVFGGDRPFWWGFMGNFGGGYTPFWRGNYGIFWRGHAVLVGIFGIPSTVAGNLHPKSGGWGGRCFPSKVGGRMGGTHFALEGIFLVASPPHYGG